MYKLMTPSSRCNWSILKVIHREKIVERSQQVSWLLLHDTWSILKVIHREKIVQRSQQLSQGWGGKYIKLKTIIDSNIICKRNLGKPILDSVYSTSISNEFSCYYVFFWYVYFPQSNAESDDSCFSKGNKDSRISLLMKE